MRDSSVNRPTQSGKHLMSNAKEVGYIHDQTLGGHLVGLPYPTVRLARGHDVFGVSLFGSMHLDAIAPSSLSPFSYDPQLPR